jgi:hypothetical protein
MFLSVCVEIGQSCLTGQSCFLGGCAPSVALQVWKIAAGLIVFLNRRKVEFGETVTLLTRHALECISPSLRFLYVWDGDGGCYRFAATVLVTRTLSARNS